MSTGRQVNIAAAAEPARAPAERHDHLCERAIDQLVDEVLDRLDALDSLVGQDHANSLVSTRLSDVRVGAQDVVRRLQSPRGCGVATSVVDALWSPTPCHRIPPTWWSTPLGKLLAITIGNHEPQHDTATL